MQKHCKCAETTKILFCCTNGWKVTLVGSRFTHPAESRYSPVEGEALAVADALDRARYFVLGCTNLIVAVDHKPLLGLLGPRPLDDISNLRLRNLKEKTLRYRFRPIHIPGAKNKASDCMSRSPSGPKVPAKFTLEDDIGAITPVSLKPRVPLPTVREHYNHTILPLDDTLEQAASASLEELPSTTWDRVQVTTSSDPMLSQLVRILEDGELPETYQDWPDGLREFHQFGDHLYTLNGVIMYKDRVVIPPPLRADCLEALHSAHQRVSKMTARAESSVFWPGISNDIAHVRDRCEHCHRIAPSQPSAPPAPRFDPTYPFQCICADFFQHKGIHYLVMVDRYSNWPIVPRTVQKVLFPASDNYLPHMV